MNSLKIITCVMLLSISSTFACDTSVCSEEKVIPLHYTGGYATVKAVVSSGEEVMVQSSNNGSISKQSIFDLALTKGCLEGICVGTKVYPRYYTGGFATVEGISKIHRVVMVKSSNDGKLYKEAVLELPKSEGCYKGLCVGDQVYPASYSGGYAIIKGINKIYKFAMVESSINQAIDQQKISNLVLGVKTSRYSDVERNSN